MSLILDALRRADAERQRGQPPGLQQVAQMAAIRSDPDARGWTPPRRWGAAAAGLALALALAALAWWMGSRQAAEPVRAQGSAGSVGSAGPNGTPASPSPVPAPAPMPVAIESPPATPPAPRIAPPAPKSPVVSLAPPRSTPAEAAARRPAPTPTPTPSQAPAPAPAPAPVPAPTPAPAAPKPAIASTPAGSQAPLPLSALAPEQRAAIVRLGLGGGVHSTDRSQRFVLVAGQITREGATLAPGIVLERIDARSVVLQLNGLRVEVPL